LEPDAPAIAQHASRYEGDGNPESHATRGAGHGNERYDRKRAGAGGAKAHSDQHAAIECHRNGIVEERLAFDDRGQRARNFQPAKDRYYRDRVGGAENGAG
jgi:hypothetical protein